MQYDIYQIKINKEVRDYVNSNDRGHKGAEEKFPIYEAYMRNTHISHRVTEFKPEDFSFYTKVCEVDGRYCGLSQGDIDYTVTNKDEVFAILNGSYYDEDTDKDIVFDKHVSGYKMKTYERDGKILEYRDMHSLSVGDIIAEVPQVGYEVMDVADIQKETRYFQVADWGFIEVFPTTLDLAVNRIKEAV